MTVSDDLYVLIKRLDKNEKAYFKKFAQLHVLGEANSYVQLFDAMDAQGKYDEAALVKQFSQGKSASQFSVLKNYLYNLVLKSLRVYHADETIRSEVKQLLVNIALLFEKGLYNQCEKLCRRCIKLCGQNELLREQGEAFAWELRLMLRNKAYDPSTIDTLNDNLNARISIFRQLQNMLQYDKLEYNVASLLRQGTAVNRKKAEQIMSDELLKNEKNALTLTAKIKYHHIYATWHYYNNDVVKCSWHQEREIAILETHPEFLKQRIQDYLLLSGNVMAIWLRQGAFKKIDERLVSFKKELQKFNASIRLWTEAIANIYIIAISRHLEDFNEEKFKQATEELEQQLKLYKAETRLHDTFTLLDLKSKAALLAGKPNEALDYSIELLNHPEVTAKFSGYNEARLINLLIHFELTNYDLLDYQIQSFRRQVMKEYNNNVYMALINFIKKFPSANNKKQKQQLFSVLEETILTCTNRTLIQWWERWSSKNAVK